MSLLWRVLTVTVLGVAFSISAVYRRRADSDRGQVSRDEDPGPVAWLIRLLLVATLLLLGAYLLVPELVAWGLVDLPAWVRWGGLAGAVAELPLLVWTLDTLGANITPTHVTREEHQLVTTGPYRYVRHPLYTLGTLLWIFLFFLSGLWPILGLIALIGGMLAYRTSLEEEALVERFGADYEAYRERTGRFLPRFR